MSENSTKSYALVFIPLLIAGGMIAVETFTTFTIDEKMIELVEYMLGGTIIGGLTRKGFNIYKENKKNAEKPT